RGFDSRRLHSLLVHRPLKWSSKATNSRWLCDLMFSGTRLLRYLVPWGDAIFNQAQADDLLNDIYIVKSNNPGTPLSEMLSKVDPLVEKLSREAPLYLWFIGD